MVLVGVLPSGCSNENLPSSTTGVQTKPLALPFYNWMPQAAPNWIFVKPATPPKKVPVRKVTPVYETVEDSNALCRNYDPFYAKAKRAVGEKYRRIEKEIAAVNRGCAQRRREKRLQEVAKPDTTRRCSQAQRALSMEDDNNPNDSGPDDKFHVPWKRDESDMASALRRVTFVRPANDRMLSLSQAALKNRLNAQWWRWQQRLLAKFEKLPLEVQVYYEALWDTVAKQCPPSERPSSQLKSSENVTDELDPRVAPVLLEENLFKRILAAMGLQSRGREENAAIQRILEEVKTENVYQLLVDGIPRLETTLVLLAVDISAKVRQSFIDAGTTAQYLTFGKYASDGDGLMDQDQAKIYVYEFATGFKCPEEGLSEKTLLHDLFNEHEDDELHPMVDGIIGLDFPSFQSMIQKYREAAQWKAHEMERTIATQYGVSNDISLVKLQGRLVPLHTVFKKYVVQDCATWEEICECLWTLGMMPKAKKVRSEALKKLVHENKCNTHPFGYSFAMYLDVVLNMREINLKSFKPTISPIFDLFDRDKSGTLEMSELNKVFMVMGVAPRTQEDQNRLLLLIDAQCENGKLDSVSISEFAGLYARVKELSQSDEYASDQRMAKEFEFTTLEVRRFRDAFTDIVRGESGYLDLLEIRTLLNSLQIYVNPEVIKSCVAQLDHSRSGYLEFGGILKLIQQLNKEHSNVNIFDKPAPLLKLSGFDNVQLWRIAEVLNLCKEVRDMGREDLVKEIGEKLQSIGLDPEADFEKALHIDSIDEFIAFIRTTFAKPRRTVTEDFLGDKDSG